MAFDLSPDCTKAATGEVGAKPFVYVWDVKTRKVLNVFRGVLKMGIELLQFSKSGLKLVAVDDTEDHAIIVYDLTDQISIGGSTILESQGGKDQLLELRWVDENQFATVGPKHFKLWTQTSNAGKDVSLASTKGRWPEGLKCSKLIATIAITPTDIVCGASDGTLQVFDRELKFKSINKLHTKSVECIYFQNNM